ncbi:MULTISPECIES: 5,6-dimethylbenzimidazole synthase [unclassified Sphingomonas]|uniref:5,6-dimethylbenzimidazole synthase n=1 Tax=unclassified Sphingomonas TaxID=196159 RepID=UPI0006FD61C4|nr:MULTISPECIES: 5,6-dimethylbenzimidazole synthase [unclassified Sphingomonas]KQS49372.1 5,6-dimethylbenzimidazole synthase [Sphingomonas sp. Leaf198]
MSAREADAPIFGPAFQAELDALFRWRRDVRRFQRDALPDGLLDRLLATANAAPSVGLSQPWRFVTVDDPARRAAVRADFEACNAVALTTQDETRVANYARLKLAGLEQAPCHVAVFVEPDPEQGHGLGRRTMPESVAYSAVIAVHTLWLAARAQGIGLGWVSILDPSRIREILDVPETWQLVAYLCIGYPEIDAVTPELERDGWEKRRSISIEAR